MCDDIKALELVSVIIPIFNAEKYINRCLDSVLSQTYVNLEIILVDDGSTDMSGQICDEYASADKRIRVVHSENKGVSNARNQALDMSTGDYIIFVDADDYIQPIYTELLLEKAREFNADCVIANINTVEVDNDKLQTDDNLCSYENCEVINMSSKEIISSLCYLTHPFPDFGLNLSAAFGCIYRKEIIGDLRFNKKEKIAEDFEFKFKLFLKLSSVVCVNVKLYNYVIRPGSAMRGKFDTGKINSICELMKLMDLDLNEDIFEALRCRIVNIAFVILFMVPLDAEHKLYRVPIIDFIKTNRTSVLKNKLARPKVKMALLASYCGFNFTQRVFQLLS